MKSKSLFLTLLRDFSPEPISEMNSGALIWSELLSRTQTKRATNALIRSSLIRSNYSSFQSRFALADDRADLARITAIVGFNFAGLIGLYFIVYTLVDLKGPVH